MGVTSNTKESLEEYMGRIKSNSENIYDRIDFHIHTTNSDGEEELLTVVDKAATQGIKAIAITDHNCFSIEQTWLYKDMFVIPGCEFSCSYQKDSCKENVEIHVIGLFPNGVVTTAFEDIFKTMKNKECYISTILDFLRTKGMNITLDEVKQQVKSETHHIGRKHIAQVMVKKQFSDNISDALDKWIGNYSPYYINPLTIIKYAGMDEIIHRIILNGGIPILTHPMSYHRFDKEDIEKLVKYFKKCTIIGEHEYPAGIEVFYEEYLADKQKTDFLNELSTRYNLYKSVASDRHGQNDVFATEGNSQLMFEMFSSIDCNILKKGS